MKLTGSRSRKKTKAAKLGPSPEEEYDFVEEKLKAAESSWLWTQIQGLYGPPVFECRARISESEGAYADAVEHRRAALEAEPDEPRHAVALARCLRLAGEFDQARSTLEEVLEAFPAHPGAHYEMAALLNRREPVTVVRPHLAQALVAWDDADSTFSTVQEARRLNERLQ